MERENPFLNPKIRRACSSSPNLLCRLLHYCRHRRRPAPRPTAASTPCHSRPDSTSIPPQKLKKYPCVSTSFSARDLVCDFDILVSGTISPGIGNLTNLQSMRLNNKSLTGTFLTIILVAPCLKFLFEHSRKGSLSLLPLPLQLVLVYSCSRERYMDGSVLSFLDHWNNS